MKAENGYRPNVPPTDAEYDEEFYQGILKRYKRQQLRTAQNRRKQLEQPILLGSSAALLLAGMICMGLFFSSWRAYQVSNDFYRDLSEQAYIAASLTETDAAVRDTPAAASRINFSALAEQNPDVAAWLSIPGLSLELPVTHTTDNDHYLHYGFDGQKNNNGCLFLATQCAPDFSDLYQVVYGHNIHNGSMFGKLSSYEDPTFYTSHPTFTLCTPSGDRTCVIFSCHPAEDNDEIYSSGWQPGEDYDAFVARMKEASLYNTGVTVPSGGRVLTLSTCASSYASNTHRFVVHAWVQD